MTDDAELLRQYANAGSESAFEELVSRHLALVYSAALRQTAGDEQRAKDVAQTVFIDLARKAASLSHQKVLTRWLYTSTRFVAAKSARGDARRKRRERVAVTMQEANTHSIPERDWNKLSLVLDEAMAELNLADRNAVLLRFFEHRELHAVGVALGVSEDAARMRVNRALEKLRDSFASRGITCAAATLGTSISANAVSVIPAGLAASISGAALATAATGTGATLSLLKFMATTKLKFGVI